MIDDELRAVGVAAEERDEAADVRVVERGLDLVEQVERARPREEEREEERDRAERLLAAGEQREPGDALPGRPQLDLDARLLALLLRLGQAQPALAAGEERRGDLGEVLLHGVEGLLEAALDRLGRARRGGCRAPPGAARGPRAACASSSRRSFSAAYSSFASGLTCPSCSRRRSSRSSARRARRGRRPRRAPRPPASSRRAASRRSASSRASSTSIARRPLARPPRGSRRSSTSAAPSSRSAAASSPALRAPCVGAARSGASRRSAARDAGAARHVDETPRRRRRAAQSGEPRQRAARAPRCALELRGLVREAAGARLQLEQHRLGRLAREPELAALAGRSRGPRASTARAWSRRAVAQARRRGGRRRGSAAAAGRGRTRFPSPRVAGSLEQRQRLGAVVARRRRGAAAERGRDRPLVPRLDVDERQREPRALARRAPAPPEACLPARRAQRSSGGEPLAATLRSSARRALAASGSSPGAASGTCLAELARAASAPPRGGARAARRRSAAGRGPGRALAPAGGVGELLLGALALGEQRLERLSTRALRATRASRRLRRPRSRRSRSAARSSCRDPRHAARRSRRRASRPARRRSPAARAAAAACAPRPRRRGRARPACATRASFSSARCRRRLKRPSPAASSTSSRRSSGLEARIASTLPWQMIECIAAPRPTSASSSTRSVRRTCALLTRYWPSPPRWRRRTIETSEKSSGGQAPSSLSKSSSTSQSVGRAACADPPKSTSSGFSARSSLGASEPAAQTIASATFDLPEPFGPTTTATPGSSRTSTGSGNDLKPRSVIERRCTRAEASGRRGWPADAAPSATASSRSERLLGGLLLGLLLRAAACPTPSCSPVDRPRRR